MSETGKRAFFELLERELREANEYYDRKDAEVLRGWRTTGPGLEENKSGRTDPAGSPEK